MSEPWIPVCEKRTNVSVSSLNPGFNAKVSTMVLPRRQYLPASVFFASITAAIPRCHILPWVVRENVTSGFRRYLLPPINDGFDNTTQHYVDCRRHNKGGSQLHMLLSTQMTPLLHCLTTTLNCPGNTSPHPRDPPHPRVCAITALASDRHARNAAVTTMTAIIS